MPIEPTIQSILSQIASPTIAWSRVFAIAGMQSAIVLCWVMYRLYLPELFDRAGLAASVVGTVLFFEVAIGFVLEPLMGYSSDRLRVWLGTRFPLILVGVLLAALMFFTLPSIAGFRTSAQRILPVAAVVWAMAMAMFRSPVLVLLGQCAMSSDLPYASGVLMAVGAVVSRLIPLTSDLWLSYGVVFTFAIGSIVLLVAAVVLRSTLPPPTPSTSDKTRSPNISHLAISLLRMLTVAIGVVCTGSWVMAVVAKTGAGSDTLPWLMANPVQVGIVGAVSCLLFGTIEKQFGMRRVVTISVGVAIAALLALSVSSNAAVVLALTISIVACQSAINVGVIPLAIEIAPVGFGGVAIGMYFGALGLAGSLFSRVFGDLSEYSPMMMAWGGVVSLVFVAIGFGWGLWRTSRST
ncbi:MAG: MFS transporter [Cyanobacteria bacterium SBC]|nr:MFS transporter [Cyanobacteria bacterium SBC]